MSYVMDHPTVAARATESARAAFIRRTYAHLAGAILAFVGLEAFLVTTVGPKELLAVLGRSPYMWLVVLGGFMLFAKERTTS